MRKVAWFQCFSCQLTLMPTVCKDCQNKCLINFGHGKLGMVMEKVMESHGILKSSKSMNRAPQSPRQSSNWMIAFMIITSADSTVAWISYTCNRVLAFYGITYITNEQIHPKHHARDIYSAILSHNRCCWLECMPFYDSFNN